MVYINECIDVNTDIKSPFKSMSCLSRKHPFPRNFLCWQAPGCIYVYSFKSMACTINGLFMKVKIIYAMACRPVHKHNYDCN